MSIPGEMGQEVHDHHRAVQEAASALRSLETQLRETALHVTAMQAELATLQDEQARDITQKILNGEDSFSLDAGRAKKIRDIGTKLSATPNVIAELEKRVADARRAEFDANSELLAAKFRCLCADRDAQASAVREHLDQLAPHLVSLISIDAIRKELPIQHASLRASDVVGDFSGEFIARKLIDSISQLIRPASLNPDVLEDSIVVRIETLKHKAMENPHEIACESALSACHSG